MKVVTIKFGLWIFFTLLLIGCKTQKEVPSGLLKLSNNNQVLFLDSTQAAQAIVTDTIDFFFEKITKLDMSIQLKKNQAELSRKLVLEQYRQYLQEEIMAFEKPEIQFIEKVFRDIFNLCDRLNPAIFPKEVKLIKVRGTHYGKSTYYTRQNCIVIPLAELIEPDYENFKRVMLHELFHIYSRYQEAQRTALYDLIGFKSIGNPEFLQMNDSLKLKVLLNPDGVNYAYAIQLKDQTKETFFAIPMVVANTNQFNPLKPAFFDHLSFSLYKINPPFSRLIKVISQNNGQSTLELKNHPEYFEQIKDNTKYIIHPDEIMADNFAIALQSLENPQILDPLSEEGKVLIEKTLKILADGTTNPW